MRILLIILAILWLVYRLTPLNSVINEYFDIKGTLFDTSNSRLVDLFSTEYDFTEEGQSVILAAKHAVVTFVPVVILIGISLVL